MIRLVFSIAVVIGVSPYASAGTSACCNVSIYEEHRVDSRSTPSAAPPYYLSSEKCTIPATDRPANSKPIPCEPTPSFPLSPVPRFAPEPSPHNSPHHSIPPPSLVSAGDRSVPPTWAVV